jgi:two-component system cell cycle sensor histidine kinase/response regulator CckA
MLDVGTELLTALGFSVLFAQSGAEALKTFRGLRSAVDILIADLVMPKMPGLPLARILKSLEPKLKVIWQTLMRCPPGSTNTPQV